MRRLLACAGFVSALGASGAARAQAAAPPSATPAREPGPEPSVAPPPLPPAPAARPAIPPDYVAPAYPPGYVAPAYHASQPPFVRPAAPPLLHQEPGRHLHDGFYLRLSLGGGFSQAKVESDDPSVADARLRGGGPAIDVRIGGTPTEGLAVGGGLFFNAIPKPEIRSSGKTEKIDGDAAFALVGPFVDGFIDPRAGLHVGAAIGAASFNIDRTSVRNSEEDPFRGFGAAIFVGYEVWVSSQWSMGAELRGLGGRGSRPMTRGGQTREERDTALGFALMLTALCH